MKLTRRGFLAGAGAVAAGSAAWGLDLNRAWADEEVAKEPAGTDEAPAEEPAAPAGPVAGLRGVSGRLHTGARGGGRAGGGSARRRRESVL